MEYQPKFNEQKATEAASILLNLKGGRVEYIWLLKMLYAVDRESFKKWERPITYDHYESMPLGPVPITIYRLITDQLPGAFWKRFILTYPKKSTHQYEVTFNGVTMPRINNLSESEVTLIKDKYEELSHMNRWELVQYTHEFFPEWEDPKDGPPTPIRLSRMLNKLKFKEKEIERIQTELAEEDAINSFFGR